MADASQNGELQEVIRNGMDAWSNDSERSYLRITQNNTYRRHTHVGALS
ncbi:MAG: hypothetical protein GQ549_05845 [Gammaproteobacteria bacterium]|nr:hypothetical protein [Gammaproteobacteria bacterium]